MRVEIVAWLLCRPWLWRVGVLEGFESVEADGAYVFEVGPVAFVWSGEADTRSLG